MQLKLSVPKCKILTINRPNKSPDNGEFFIQNQRMEETNEIRDLGIIIDEKLSFDSHCSLKTKQASKIINAIYRTFKTRDTEFLLKLYKTYVLPVLDYGSTVYSPSTKKNIRLLESVQRHFTRRIPQFQGKDLPYSSRLNILGLNSLEKRRLKADLCEAYRIMYGHSDVDDRDFFDFSINNNQTRSNGLKVRIEKCGKSKRKSFFSNRVANVWNALPRDVVTAHSVHAFKLLLDSNLKDMPLLN